MYEGVEDWSAVQKSNVSESVCRCLPWYDTICKGTSKARHPSPPEVPSSSRVICETVISGTGMSTRALDENEYPDRPVPALFATHHHQH